MCADGIVVIFVAIYRIRIIRRTTSCAHPSRPVARTPSGDACFLLQAYGNAIFRTSTGS